MTDLVDTPHAPTPDLEAAVLAPTSPPVAFPANAAGTDAEEDDGGLGRALVLGGLAGFLVVYAIAFVLFQLFGGYGTEVAAGASVFVGLFGGVGFGAMVGASVH